MPKLLFCIVSFRIILFTFLPHLAAVFEFMHSKSQWQCRNYFVYVPSQLEVISHCNSICHWLGAYTKFSLIVSYNGKIIKTNIDVSVQGEKSIFTKLSLILPVQGMNTDVWIPKLPWQWIVTTSYHMCDVLHWSGNFHHHKICKISCHNNLVFPSWESITEEIFNAWCLV